jgi:hypothetical protein
MDSQNTLTQYILQPNQPISTSIDNTYSNEGFFSNLTKINATTWLIIILILAFLGFNIFIYLAKGTQSITNFVTPLLKKIFGSTIAVTSQTIDVSAEGAKTVVGETANIINSGLTTIQNITPNITPNPSNSQSVVKSNLPQVKGQPINQQQVDLLQQSTLNKALNTAQSKQLEQDYEADIASSSIQSKGKVGWCYIGTEKGFRSCAQVGVNDICMSGDIFPSQEICINPSLRP